MIAAFGRMREAGEALKIFSQMLEVRGCPTSPVAPHSPPTQAHPVEHLNGYQELFVTSTSRSMAPSGRSTHTQQCCTRAASRASGTRRWGCAPLSQPDCNLLVAARWAAADSTCPPPPLLQVLREMESDGVEVTCYAASLLVRTGAEAEKWREALLVYEVRPRRPLVEIFAASRLRAQAITLESTRSFAFFSLPATTSPTGLLVTKVLVNKGLKPDVTLECAMLQVAANAGYWPRAEKMYAQMIGQGAAERQTCLTVSRA